MCMRIIDEEIEGIKGIYIYIYPTHVDIANAIKKEKTEYMCVYQVYMFVIYTYIWFICLRRYRM